MNKTNVYEAVGTIKGILIRKYDPETKRHQKLIQKKKAEKKKLAKKSKVKKAVENGN